MFCTLRWQTSIYHYDPRISSFPFSKFPYHYLGFSLAGFTMFHFLRFRIIHHYSTFIVTLTIYFYLGYFTAVSICILLKVIFSFNTNFNNISVIVSMDFPLYYKNTAFAKAFILLLIRRYLPFHKQLFLDEITSLKHQHC